MVEEKVKKILADILGIEKEEEITADSDIIDDLAAESIDFIDICFRLEKDFNLGKVNVNSIFPVIPKDEKIIDDSGDIKETVIAKLMESHPHVQGELLDELKRTKNQRVFLKTKILFHYVNHTLSRMQGHTPAMK